MFSHIFSCTYSRFTPVVFFEAEGTGAGGATLPSETPPSNSATKPTDVESVVQRTIESVLGSKRVNGDTSAALEVLAAKALKEEQRAKAAEAKLGVIPDDVKAKLDAYETLGSAEDLSKRLEAATTLEAEKVQRDRTDAFRTAAVAAGYDADALLEVIGEVPATLLEIVKNGDKEVSVAKVKILSDGKEEEKPFEDFIKSRFTKIHDSLKANATPRVTAPVMGVNGGIEQTRPVQKPAAYRM